MFFCFRCEMEKQILGKVHGNRSNWYNSCNSASVSAASTYYYPQTKQGCIYKIEPQLQYGSIPLRAFAIGLKSKILQQFFCPYTVRIVLQILRKLIYPFFKRRLQASYLWYMGVMDSFLSLATLTALNNESAPWVRDSVLCFLQCLTQWSWSLLGPTAI